MRKLRSKPWSKLSWSALWDAKSTGCTTPPTHGAHGSKKREFCSDHKKEGMVDIVNGGGGGGGGEGLFNLNQRTAPDDFFSENEVEPEDEPEEEEPTAGPEKGKKPRVQSWLL